MKLMRYVFFALMFICLVYSVSIYLVGSGTFSFMIWIVGAIFFGVAFFFSGKGRWLKVPVLFRTIIYSLIALVVLVLVICTIAMVSHFGDKGEKNLDYIVVLGAQMREHGPSNIFKYRLDAAYAYLSENPDAVCIVSGGKGVNEPVSEGEGGKEYLISRGVAQDRIIAETEAMDTSENISYSLDIMKQAAGIDEKLRIGIVTNNFHVFRGVHLAKKLTDHEICGIAAYTIPWYLPNNMVRECFGIVRDIFKFK
jgi:uncharacterized SAM-binding protein YcdF (DUF218 family)